MSARFGRNQRRKMREQVASLTASRDTHVRRTVEAQAETREIASRLHRWAEDIAQLMGPDSAFNEQVRLMGVEDVHSYGGRLRLAPVDLARFAPNCASVGIASVSTVIEALIWRLHLSRDEFRPMVRIELVNRYAQPVGYVLPIGHKWTGRDEEYLARRIAREMTGVINGPADTAA